MFWKKKVLRPPRHTEEDFKSVVKEVEDPTLQVEIHFSSRKTVTVELRGISYDDQLFIQHGGDDYDIVEGYFNTARDQLNNFKRDCVFEITPNVLIDMRKIDFLSIKELDKTVLRRTMVTRA